MIEWLNNLLGIVPAFAQEEGAASVTKLGTLLAALSAFVADVQGYLGPIAGAAIVIMLMVAGIQYINGNPEAGKKTLITAIIGMVIVALAAVLVYTLNSLALSTYSTE